ncbi:hypothetical protein Pint_22059 [Pistacia integerrima]|uniref:Uncharacterized protein n=1 Tax=Pistacia integerrima TaxID=434235 RepID=A0ACC0YN79_9ROSI|nr:hypothetical protein Pint_22059 [Pistacia integerrima]
MHFSTEPVALALANNWSHAFPYGINSSYEIEEVSLEWIFAISNFILELPSVVLDQLSSAHKPQYTLFAMLISFSALFICITELIYKGRKEKIICRWRGCLPWFYNASQNYKPFGTFKDTVGSLCALCQCVFTTVNYAQADTIKISVWPVIFAFGLLWSKMLENPERRTAVQYNMSSYLEGKDWELPKVSKKEIYGTKTSIFNFKKNHSFKTIEDTILLPHGKQPIQLFNPEAIEKHKKKYKFLHIGLVQVGVRSLSREDHEASVLLCLRDKRILDFDSSILSVLESTLADGPVHFHYHPNMIVSLEDPKILQVLSLYIKFNNLEIQGTTFPFVLMYRVHYKCMQNPINSGAKRSSHVGETTFQKTKVRIPTNVIVWSLFGLQTDRIEPTVESETIKWSDVRFPEEWKLRDENPPESPEYACPPRMEFQGGFRPQF